MSTWRPGWGAFPQPLLDFWTERHLCVLTTLWPDGRPHSVPVGVALDHEERCAWVITNATSRKARNLAAPSPITACQVDGPRWATLEGTGVIKFGAEAVERAVEMYAGRYRVPRPNPTRVALRIEVDRFAASAKLLEPAPASD